MMPKFYDYIVAVELAENPYTAPPYVTTEIDPFISMNIMWGNQELIQGVVIFLEKV